MLPNILVSTEFDATLLGWSGNIAFSSFLVPTLVSNAQYHTHVSFPPAPGYLSWPAKRRFLDGPLSLLKQLYPKAHSRFSHHPDPKAKIPIHHPLHLPARAKFQSFKNVPLGVRLSISESFTHTKIPILRCISPIFQKTPISLQFPSISSPPRLPYFPPHLPPHSPPH